MRSLLIAVLAVGLLACSKDDSKDKGGDEAAKGAPAPEANQPPAKPFEGQLTAERMKKAKDAVKPFMKWDEANAVLLATVGKPHEVEGGDNNWYLLMGDKCHELSVENANGEVGAVGLGEYDKMMKSQYDKCLKYSGDGGAAAAAAAGDGDKADTPAKQDVAKIKAGANVKVGGSVKVGGDVKAGGDDKSDDDEDDGGW
jgi:hypothetical protein